MMMVSKNLNRVPFKAQRRCKWGPIKIVQLNYAWRKKISCAPLEATHFACGTAAGGISAEKKNDSAR